MQLTAEQLVPRKNRNGFTKMEWELIPGRENHGLDRRVYARAAAAFCGLDRFSEKHWLELEGKIKQMQAQSESGKPEAKKKNGRRDNWIEKRPKNWLKNEE